MTPISERKNGAVSTAELERRWAAIRLGMEAAGIDVLVAQCNNDHMGGSVKYLTDFPATNGYPMIVVFPRDEDMTLIRQGPRDGVTELSREGNGVFRGVRRMLTMPSFVTAPLGAHADADLAVDALQPYARGTIGLIGLTQMSYAVGTRLRERLPNAHFADATEIVDAVKSVRSAEEIAHLRDTVALQDAAMRIAFDAAEPGMRESEVISTALQYCQSQGTEQGIFLCASGPAGTPMRMSPRHMQNRVLQQGDQFVLLVETNGPAGQYAEIGRTLFFGEIPSKMRDEFAFALEARQFILSRLTPGAALADVYNDYNRFMRANGRPEDSRLVGHAQGYDMVERPLIRDDETMTVATNMNFAVHPTYQHLGSMHFVCDNYLVGADGGIERLHQFPEELVAK